MAHSGFVSVVGRPNVGKSTLINRVVGQKVAIVTPKPQTTRNRILAVANTRRAQIVFFDTPGIHKPQNQLNRLMVDSAVSSLSRVDLVVLMVDITHPSSGGDRHVLELVREVRVPVFLIINKMDRVPKEKALPLIEEYRKLHGFAEIVPISALTGDNVPRLVELLEDYLPEAPPLFPADMLTDLPERFFAAEIIREKILLYVREEVPHATAVQIDSWKDEAKLTRIEASILVERDSQKGILVGSKGSMLKKIGTAARRELERFLNTHVYLGLHVKVRERWRENRRLLAELGMEPPRD
ncbi:MAG TPA: GTPase Era [Vicinamibacteria bacterium]